MPDDVGTRKDRTELAEYRTILANERTFASWSRTGLAALATGYVVARLAIDVQPRWAAIALGAFLCFVSAGLQLLGLAVFVRTRRWLEQPPAMGMVWLSALLALTLAVLSLVAGLLLLFG